jgi:hypothetical protein
VLSPASRDILILLGGVGEGKRLGAEVGVGVGTLRGLTHPCPTSETRPHLLESPAKKKTTSFDASPRVAMRVLVRAVSGSAICTAVWGFVSLAWQASV